jgi:hypothetical protein
MVQEHGRFSDVGGFSAICQNQYVPVQTNPGLVHQQNQVFLGWRAALLSTLAANHGNHWLVFSG